MKRSNRPIRVLSLFDGLSAARVALDRAGIPVETYYASEIDPWAVEISTRNYPETIHLGDIREIDGKALGEIDLIVGGSPCQDLSIAGFRNGFKGKRSRLFFEFVRLIHEIKPRYFLLENVASMKPGARKRISKEMGVEPVRINSSLVSAQNRDRLFWTNAGEIPQPKNRKIYLGDILEKSVSEGMDPALKSSGRINDITGKKKPSDYLPKGAGDSWRLDKPQRCGHIGTQGQNGRIFGIYGKSSALATSGRVLVTDYKYFRPITPIEAERLQNLPDNYTFGVSKTQRMKMLGNGFTVDVIAHILRHMDFSGKTLSGAAVLPLPVSPSLRLQAHALELRLRLQKRLAA